MSDLTVQTDDDCKKIAVRRRGADLKAKKKPVNVNSQADRVIVDGEAGKYGIVSSSIGKKRAREERENKDNDNNDMAEQGTYGTQNVARRLFLPPHGEESTKSPRKRNKPA